MKEEFNLDELLSALSSVAGVQVFLLPSTEPSALTPLQEVCSCCVHQPDSPTCASLRAALLRGQPHSCLAGRSFLFREISADDGTHGTLVLADRRFIDTERGRALGVLLEACACAILRHRLLKSSDAQLSALDACISAHLTEPLTPELLCAALSISGSALARLTRRTADCTPGQYIQLCRLDKAGILATQTQLSIKEIAVRCGISDYNYFSRIFKKRFGISPTEMRRRHAPARGSRLPD